MGDFADATDPASKFETDPGEDDAAGLEEAINNAGWQVQSVNRVYGQVTGQNLVEQLISPLAGDFAQIRKNATAWGEVGDALRAARENLSAGVSELRESWDGAGVMAFETMMVSTRTVALEADAGVADLVGMGFNKAADVSERLRNKALELLTKLVDRLIEAAATGWVPGVGWANLVRKVVQCIDLVTTIHDMIQSIVQLYQGIVRMVEGIEAAGTSLPGIGEISGGGDGPRSPGDMTNLVLDRGGELGGAATSGHGCRQSGAGLRHSDA
ncbi:hypothetical protein FHX42_004525 [Saccharopolyspora lacisalsi]|uniref:WXG100 family type VII secretion target n=1 Tax=Halosaccharopolyspora lacisalsi TaxID=1000566 RepID=A0A839E777_9PSEU|nr:hypothetical protein [Halosaccharopolyspora lacisalsi]MBA8827141.1 hypothetical protein [Halosaccharopolyspora lacisalsi]